jgi:serine phosphatase RsbU (regulator of sigma subunit)|mmetsp:Transcript_21485/g.28794  ORF Transcript_21485/g.28794 Transcript_21485/m.28794 type:complete len:145 (+) Transcript_21485:892-1326(+)
MLPEYAKNELNCILFMAFLCIALYFLANVLLANVYGKFLARLNREDKQIVKMQEEHLNEMLRRIAKDEDGNECDYLTSEQTKRFFVEIMTLNIKEKRYDYDTFQRILLEMQVQDVQKITKREFLEFFLLNEGYSRLKTVQETLK